MAINYGNLSTENVLQTNRLYDVTDAIYLTYPDQSPFIATQVAAGSMMTSDPEFWWFTRDDRAKYDQINNGAGYLAGDTSIVVDNADKFVPGDQVVHVKTSDGSYNETMRITAVNTGTNTLTVSRGTGSTSAGALADNDYLLRIGSAFEEGSSLPDPMSQQLVKYYNYTQILRTSSVYSRTFLQTKMRAGNRDKEIQKRRQEKTEEHKRDIEAMLLWGERGIEGDGTSQPNRKTGGLNYWINVANAAGFDNTTSVAAGNLTLAGWESFLEAKAFAFGSDEKYMFCSPRVISVINNLLRGYVQLENKLTEYGMNVTKYHSPHGTINIVRHRQFTTGIYQYAGLIVDPNHVSLRFINEGVTSFKTDVGLEGNDEYEDSWLTEVGLQVTIPQSLALITNVQAAA